MRATSYPDSQTFFREDKPGAVDATTDGDSGWQETYSFSGTGGKVIIILIIVGLRIKYVRLSRELINNAIKPSGCTQREIFPSRHNLFAKGAVNNIILSRVFSLG